MAYNVFIKDLECWFLFLKQQYIYVVFDSNYIVVTLLLLCNNIVSIYFVKKSD